MTAQVTYLADTIDRMVVERFVRDNFGRTIYTPDLRRWLVWIDADLFDDANWDDRSDAAINGNWFGYWDFPRRDDFDHQAMMRANHALIDELGERLPTDVVNYAANYELIKRLAQAQRWARVQRQLRLARDELAQPIVTVSDEFLPLHLIERKREKQRQEHRRVPA